MLEQSTIQSQFGSLNSPNTCANTIHILYTWQRLDDGYYCSTYNLNLSAWTVPFFWVLDRVFSWWYWYLFHIHVWWQDWAFTADILWTQTVPSLTEGWLSYTIQIGLWSSSLQVYTTQFWDVFGVIFHSLHNLECEIIYSIHTVPKLT